MDEHFLELCIREVRMQSRFALAAFQGMVNELNSIDAHHEQQHAQAEAVRAHYQQLRDALWSTEADFHAKYHELADQQSRALEEVYDAGVTWPVFYYTYSFLLHAASVSKLLWPGETVHGKDKRKVGPKVDELIKLRSSRGPGIRSALVMEDGVWLIADKQLRDNLEHYDERMEAWFVSSKQKNVIDWSLMSRTAVAGFLAEDFRRLLDPQSLMFHMEETDSDLVAMVREVETIHSKAKLWLRENTGPAKWRNQQPNQ